MGISLVHNTGTTLSLRRCIIWGACTLSRDQSHVSGGADCRAKRGTTPTFQKYGSKGLTGRSSFAAETCIPERTWIGKLQKNTVRFTTGDVSIHVVSDVRQGGDNRATSRYLPRLNWVQRLAGLRHHILETKQKSETVVEKTNTNALVVPSKGLKYCRLEMT